MTPATIRVTAGADFGGWLGCRGFSVFPADRRRFDEWPIESAGPSLEPSFVIARG